MYEHGFGVPQAYEEATALYSRAAAQGDATAQYLLGLSYDKGHGLPQNYVLAYKWLALAAAHAPKGQRYYLRLRDAVASKLTPNQIADGQRLALFLGACALDVFYGRLLSSGCSPHRGAAPTSMSKRSSTRPTEWSTISSIVAGLA